LLLDANQCFSVEHAIELGQQLQCFNPGWFEEPVDYQNLKGCAAVRSHVPIPIAGGETEYTHVGMQRYLNAGAVDVLMPDLQRVGGYSEFLRAADIANDFGVPVSTHIFTEHSVCLAASIEQCISVEYMPWFLPLFNEEIEMVDGEIIVPDTPGTGFTFNHSRIKEYRIV